MDSGVWLTDSTLREGQQAAGFQPSLKTKVSIAHGLNALGCDIIEVGHPAVSPDHETAAKTIARLGLQAETLAHCLLDEEAIRKTADLGVGWIGLFLCIRPEATEAKYRGRYQDLCGNIDRCVSLAKALGLQVRFSCEDASRTDDDELNGFYRKLADDGVDMIGFADTVGCLTPIESQRRFTGMRNLFPNVRLHFHGHNDRGLANANTLSALHTGWDSIDASVLGLGERMGIASLTEIALLMKGQFDKPLSLSHCLSLEEIVWANLDLNAYQHRRFSHKAGLHSAVVFEHPELYESVKSDEMGVIRRAGLTPYSGARAVREIAKSVQIELSHEQAAAISTHLKQQTNEYWQRDEIEALIKTVLSLNSNFTINRP